MVENRAAVECGIAVHGHCFDIGNSEISVKGKVRYVKRGTRNGAKDFGLQGLDF